MVCIFNIEYQSWNLWWSRVICYKENSIFSMLLKGYGHFFAAIIMNKTKKSRLNIFNTRYKENLFLFVDQVHNV